MRVLLTAITTVVLFACAPNVFAKDRADLRVEEALSKSLPRFACNLSPTKWKKKVERVIDGQLQTVEISAAKGSIIAAPHLRDPDYFFHWNRDSALVVDSLVRFIDFVRGTSREAWLHDFIRDYVRFSHELQQTSSSYGIGEVRFNVDGSVDDLPWSRPQNDGPALRALTLLRYYSRYSKHADSNLKNLVLDVVTTDIEYLARNVNERSFDLWEYSIGYHFYTRMVQLGALEEATRVFPQKASPTWYKAIADLKTALKTHWDTEKEFYSFSVGPVFDQPGNPVGQPGGGLDSSTVLAALHSRRFDSELSFVDERLQFTLAKLENYFRTNFPINFPSSGQKGPAIGRHPGDGYYGGNAWYFLTAAFGEYYYRLAGYYGSRSHSVLTVSQFNKDLFESVMGRHLRIGENLTGDKVHRKFLVSKLLEKGDAFLSTVTKYIPSGGPNDGMMAEQFSKVDGSPVSATDLTWSYSGFLSAVLERPVKFEIDFAKMDFACPTQ